MKVCPLSERTKGTPSGSIPERQPSKSGEPGPCPWPFRVLFMGRRQVGRVAQWIEHWPPEPGAVVRFHPRALIRRKNDP